MEGIHDGGESIVLKRIPPRRLRMWQDISVKGIQIEENVDSGFIESSHAGVMVGARIDVIDADGIGAERLHEVGIALALVTLGEGIVVGELICDSLEEELLAIARVEFAAFDIDGREGGSPARESQ